MAAGGADETLLSNDIAPIRVKSNRSADQIVNQKHDHGASNRDKHAVEVQACHAFLAEKTEEIAPDKRAYNPKQDIQQEALALPVDDLGSDETCDQAKDDPTQDTHLRTSLCCVRPDWLMVSFGLRGR
jgi:hypothetical protein